MKDNLNTFTNEVKFAAVKIGQAFECEGNCFFKASEIEATKSNGVIFAFNKKSIVKVAGGAMTKVKLSRAQRYRAGKLGIDCKMVSELDLDRIKRYKPTRSGPKGNKFVTEMVKVGGLSYDKIKRRAKKLGIDKVSSREDVERILNYQNKGHKAPMREELHGQKNP